MKNKHDLSFLDGKFLLQDKVKVNNLDILFKKIN